MKKLAIVDKISGKFGKAGLTLKKYSPEILVVTGVVGVVTSAVMACTATTKVSTILEAAKDDIAQVHEAEDIYEDEEYSAEDAKKDLAIIYIQTGVKLAKLYAPAVILGTLSITSILASNNILRKRNVALGAAYAAIDHSFKEYRNRVIERFGDTVDRELKYGVKTQKVEEVVTDEETGKQKKVKKTVEVVDGPIDCSPYARFFEPGLETYDDDHDRNMFFLRAEQNFANERLRTRGYITLNEIYERLGFRPCKMGQIVGWVYNPDNPEGDNYIDFGIYDAMKPKNMDFVNGFEPAILLDFNVQGNILDLIATSYRQ